MSEPVETQELPPYTPENDTFENNVIAKNILVSAVTRAANLESEMKTEMLAKVIAPAVNFLCKNNYDKIVKFICMTLKSSLSTVLLRTDIKNEWYAKLVFIAAFRFIPAQLHDTLTEPEPIRNLIYNCLDFYAANSLCSTSALKTVNFILKKHGNLIIGRLQHVVLIMTSTQLSSKLQNIFKLARECIATLFQCMDDNFKRNLLVNFMHSQPWYKSSYVLTTLLLRSIKDITFTHEDIVKLMGAIKSGLRHSALCFEANNLFEVLIELCGIEVVDSQITPIIAKWRKDANTFFILNTDKYILNKCVKMRRLDFYRNLSALDTDDTTLVHVLYLIICNGFETPECFAVEIENYLDCNETQIRNLLFLALCVHLRSSERITTWRIGLIQKCLQNNLIDTTDKNLQRAFKCFVERICICSCSILHNFHQNDVIDFLQPYYNFMAYILYYTFRCCTVYTEESLKLAEFFFDAISVAFARKHSPVKDLTSLHLYVHRAFAEHLHDEYLELLTTSVVLLIKKISLDPNYYEEAFSIIMDNMIPHLDEADNDYISKLIISNANKGTFASGQKCKQLVMILIKKYNMEYMESVPLTSTLQQIVNHQFGRILEDGSFMDNPLIGALGCWNLIMNNTKYSLLDKDAVIFMYASAEDIIKFVINIIIDDKIPEDCDKKIIEHILITAIEVMASTVVFAKLEPSFLEPFLEAAESIIISSNMRRPVTVAATTYENICRHLARKPNEFNEFVERKLEEVLNLAATTQTLRKTPESRIIIKSIVLADRTDDHIHLTRIIHYLLNYVKETKSDEENEISIAAALFSLNAIMEDKSLNNTTVLYESDILISGFEMFRSNCFLVKNAALQLIQTMTSKILGQADHELDKQLTSQDFFITYIPLITYMLDVLDATSEDIDESKVAVLLFLSQIITLSNCLECPKSKENCEKFIIKLVQLIKTSPDKIGYYAGEAYVALVDLRNVANAVKITVDYIKCKISEISRNEILNLLHIIANLKHRYYVCVGKLDENMIAIKNSRKELAEFLSNLAIHENLRTLLNVTGNVEIFEQTKEMLVNSELSGFQRVELQRNFEYLVASLNADELDIIVPLCLETSKYSVQNLCLKCILHKLEIQTSTQLLLVNKTNILNTLSKYLFTQESHGYTYYIICITIMFLLHIAADSYRLPLEIYQLLLDDYRKPSCRKSLAIHIALMNSLESVTLQDVSVARELLNVTVPQIYSDSKADKYLLSYSLLYFNNIVPVHDRPKILQTAILFLLLDESYTCINKFFYAILQVPPSFDKFTTLGVLINVDLLAVYLGSVTNAKEFLLNLSFEVFSKRMSLSKVFGGGFYSSTANDHVHVILLNMIFEHLSTIDHFPHAEFIRAIRNNIGRSP